jgi:DUF4097 and DUF4098 domain-containing protein YvlB
LAYEQTLPRRRSIFSGLILIIVGLLFLLHNFRYNLPVWRILERWWPLLFIIWGLAKLYDRMVAQRSGEAAPATISGGEIALIIILLVVIGSAGLIDWGGSHPGRGFWVPWEDSYTFSEDTPAVSVPTNAQISVRADRGDINVYGDETNQIRVTTRKTAYGDSENEGKDRADHVHVSVNQTGSSYIVEPSESAGEGRPVRTDMEVHVPKGAALSVDSENGAVQVSSVSGNVNVTDRHGDTEVRAAGADVTVDESGGNVTVTGANGDVRVTGHGNDIEIANVQGSASTQGTFDGLRFEHVTKGVRFLSNRTDLTVSQLNGRLELEGGGNLTLSDASGNVSLVTKDRDITFENVTGRIHVENTQGAVSLRFAQAPAEQIEISNRSGDINLELPSKSAFDLDARSDNGEIETEWGDQSKVSTLQGNAVLVESFGERGPKVLLRTTYGTIHLRKGQ